MQTLARMTLIWARSTSSLQLSKKLNTRRTPSRNTCPDSEWKVNLESGFLENCVTTVVTVLESSRRPGSFAPTDVILAGVHVSKCLHLSGVVKFYAECSMFSVWEAVGVNTVEFYNILSGIDTKIPSIDLVLCEKCEDNGAGQDADIIYLRCYNYKPYQ